MIEQYELEKLLGKGAFSEVSKAKNKETNEIVAVKKINKNQIQGYINYIDTEISLIESLKHENVSAFYSAFEDNDYVYIIQEYCNGGNLRDYLNKTKKL